LNKEILTEFFKRNIYMNLLKNFVFSKNMLESSEKKHL